MSIPLALLLAYLLGSLSGSLLLGRWIGVDIRTQGSGNAGGTNALRTRGWRFALGVAAIDVGKGAAAVAIADALLPSGQPLRDYWLAASVLAATAGHVWPLFFGFRGGKGAATLVGGCLCFWPLAVPAVMLVWLLGLMLSGYVGPITVLAAWMLLPMAWLDPGPAHLAFALCASSFISYTHRSNLQRCWRGEEYRFEKARLLHRWRHR